MKSSFWGMVFAVGLMAASPGSYAWAGAADTHFWIDPEKNLIGLALTQQFSNRSPLRDDMRVMTYQALME